MYRERILSKAVLVMPLKKIFVIEWSNVYEIVLEVLFSSVFNLRLFSESLLHKISQYNSTASSMTKIIENGESYLLI